MRTRVSTIPRNASLKTLTGDHARKPQFSGCVCSYSYSYSVLPEYSLPHTKTLQVLLLRTYVLVLLLTYSPEYSLPQTRKLRVFWLDVPSLVMVVKWTIIGPHACVCAPFSFAQTEVVVLVFPFSYYINGRLTNFFFASFKTDILFLWLRKEPLKESKELRAALAREELVRCCFYCIVKNARSYGFAVFIDTCIIHLHSFC